MYVSVAIEMQKIVLYWKELKWFPLASLFINSTYNHHNFVRGAAFRISPLTGVLSIGSRYAL